MSADDQATPQVVEIPSTQMAPADQGETLPFALTQPSLKKTSATLPCVPGYEVIDELGRGGMGVVYRAIQSELKRVVALKMILGGSQAAPSEVQRFHVEVEAAARLSHVHIVPIYEVGTHDGHHYFSMKLCEGGSLAQAIARGDWKADTLDDQKRIAEFMACVARAVQCAHDEGILHRDLKPGNILLDSQCQPHITDFGLAKRVEGGQSLTQTGTVLGTPSYMAPEQAGGKKLTAAADVYSLGAILYEMLTRRPPFTGENPLEILLQVAGQDPVPPRTLCPTVARDLETICLKALAKEPLHRYRTAAEFADDLDRYAQGQSIKGQRLSYVQKLQQWSQRNPVAARISGLAAGALLILIGLAAVFLVLANRSDGSYDRVRAAGKLVVAIDPVYPPMEFERDGVMAGFDVDLARAIAKRLGVQADLRLMHLNWRDVPAALKERKCDVVISSWTITDERKREVNFVEYLRMGQVFVCAKGGKVTAERDLADRIVVVNADTLGHKFMQNLQQKGVKLKQLIVLSGSDDPFPLLKNGQADVTIVDEPVGRYHARQDPQLTVTGHVGHAMDPNPIGIVCRTADVQLQQVLADALHDLKADGEFSNLLQTWFGQ